MILCTMLISLVFTRCKNSEIELEDDGKPVKSSIWAAPAEQKIRRDAPIEKTNLIWSDETNTIKIFGAGNENVPFQIIISTKSGTKSQQEEKTNGFEIAISDLTSEDDNKILEKNFNLYLEHYIWISSESSPAGAVGYWPDALVPIKVPFSISSEGSTIRNNPVWVNLLIPPFTPGGIYQGTITITQQELLIATLMIEVEVFRFSLPEKTPLITYINVSKEQLANFYGKPEYSAEIVNLTQKYYEYLYASRMEPWFNDMLTPTVTVKGEMVELNFEHSRYLHYMNELNTKRVLLHAFPGNLGRQISADKFTPEFDRLVKSYLIQVESYFKKNGWEEKLVFNSPIDEPNSLEAYEDTRKWGALVNEATPDVPFLVTKTPVPPRNHPEWGTLQDYVDNYSIHGNQLNDFQIIQAIQDEKARGGELTWYISCDQRYPQPNYFIDAPAMDPVMVPWITAKYDLDGILYWAINWWNETSNPWEDTNTFHSGFSCSGGWTLNGEGSLWYPGNYAERYTGQPNVNGPVSSIRFELLREGIEDYVYLSMLEDLGNKQFAQEQVRKLVVDVGEFSRNVEELYKVRKNMAKRLEE